MIPVDMHIDVCLMEDWRTSCVRCCMNMKSIVKLEARCRWKYYCCLNVTVDGYHSCPCTKQLYERSFSFFLLSMSYLSWIVLVYTALLTGTFEVFYTFILWSQIFASENMKSLLFQNVTPVLTVKPSLPESFVSFRRNYIRVNTESASNWLPLSRKESLLMLRSFIAVGLNLIYLINLCRNVCIISYE